MKKIGTLRSALFAVAVAGTLGFGATQALAAPGAPAKGQSCYAECEWLCGPPGGYPVRPGMCVCCDGGPAAE